MIKPGARAPSGGFLWRYFTSLALFVVIGVALPMALVLPGQRTFLRESARAETVRTAELAGRALANALATGNVADLKNEIASLRRAFDSFGEIVVASPAGKIVAHDDPSQEGKLEVDLFPPPVSTVVRTARGKDGTAWLEMTLPLATGNTIRGTLRTALRIPDVAGGTWSGIEHLAALTACLLGLGFLISLHLSRAHAGAKFVVRERAAPARTEEKIPIPAAAPPPAPASPPNELLAAVVDATPAALFVVDEVTRKIHHANGAFCRLWGLDDLEDGLRTATVDYDTVAARCNAAAETVVLPVALGTADLDPLRLVDEELRCRDGRIVRCFSFPLNQGGRHVRLYFHTDITADRRREQELMQVAKAAQEAIREKAAFSAQMAHTLRAPLNRMLDTLGPLCATVLTNQQTAYLDTVREAADDALGIVKNLIELAAIEAGTLQLSSGPLALRKVVHESLEPFALLAHRKSIDLAGAIADGLPSGFHGDADRLRQVLTNLVSSALHATEHGELIVNVSAAPVEVAAGSAGIRIATDGSRSRAQGARQVASRITLRFEVRHTAPGLSPDEQASLFQVMATQSADAQYRTHLPLQVAKRLAELMGGHVGVESDAADGNTLWFTVPLPVDPQATEDINPSVDTFSASHVLVVDDNATVRTLLAQQLRAWHITGEGAASGREALRLLRTAADHGTPYGAVIIDAQMPEMDGLTLAEAIRHDAQLDSVPLILLTSTPQLSGDTYPGIAATLSKPIHPSTLYDILLAHLGVAAGAGRAAAPRLAVSRKSRPRGHLLLAEDNLVNQKIALRMLDKLGYQTDVVTNGNDAVEAASRIPYDAILMDCQMPEMDGLTAATTIRRHEGGDRHVPIIAVTANSMDADRARCLEAGMDDFLAKPVRAADLEAILARWSTPEGAPAGDGTLRLAPSAAQSA